MEPINSNKQYEAKECRQREW